MPESATEREERVSKELREHYTRLGEEANQAALDARVDPVSETKEEYELRISNVPGIFGDYSAADLLAFRKEDVKEEEDGDEDASDEDGSVEDEPVVEPNALNENIKGERIDFDDPDNGGSGVSSDTFGDVQFEEAPELQDARKGAAVDPSGQANESQTDEDNEEAPEEVHERRHAREVVKDVKVAESVEDVDLLVEDDDRKSVVEAARERREELSK